MSKEVIPKATAQDTVDSKGKSAGKHHRHMANYLLDKSLQLRYIAFVTILSALICATLGYLIYRQEHRASNTIIETMESMPGGAAYWQETRADVDEKLAKDDGSLILIMAGIFVGLVLVLSFYLMIMTHKVAGPLHKISGYFDRMRDGRLGDTWPLRKGDMLMDFYGQFKEMHDIARKRFTKDNEAVDRFLRACDQGGVKRDGPLGKQLDKLEEHKTKRKDSVACD